MCKVMNVGGGFVDAGNSKHNSEQTHRTGFEPKLYTRFPSHVSQILYQQGASRELKDMVNN